MSKIAYYKSNKDKEPVVIDATWEELTEMLLDVRETDCHPCKGKDCPHKYVDAWSPVDIEGTRKIEHVRAVTFASFDLDHLDDAALEAVLTTVLDGALEAVIHRTHTAGCYRLVMPLSRDVTAKEWPVFLRTCVAEMRLPSDPACKDVTRIYFMPTAPKGSQLFTWRNMGLSLDVDAILARAPKLGTSSVVLPDEPPEPSDFEEGTSLDDLRATLRSLRKRKASSTNPDDEERYELLGRILNGEPLAQEGSRDVTVNKAAAMLAFAFPVGTPWEAAVEILRPSISEMPTEPEGLEKWLGKAERRFISHAERRVTLDAERDERNRKVHERISALARKRKPPAAETTAAAEEDDDEDWQSLLMKRADGQIKSCGYNASIILARDPDVRGSIRFNLVTKELEIHGGVFANVALEVLDTHVMNWLQATYGLGLSTGEVGQQLAVVARANSHDPPKDHLNELAWDGVRRLDDMLLTYFSAETENASGQDVTAHVRTISRRWMIGTVARALEPGCQMDNVLVIEGPQGARKTSALRVLGGRWCTEHSGIIGDKDGKMLTASHWIVELPELAGLRRTDVNAIKADITVRIDTYRPPYGRVMIKTARRCVFVATVNPEEGGYLVDRTGNRRFWPVYCQKIDLHRLERDRDQLWAEAVHLFRQGERWWLDETEKHAADDAAEERETENGTEQAVAKWWYAQHPSKRPAVIDGLTVAEQALHLDTDRAVQRTVQTEIGIAMRRCGFRKRRALVQGRRVWLYEPTDEMRRAPQGGKPNHLKAVRDEDAGQG